MYLVYVSFSEPQQLPKYKGGLVTHMDHSEGETETFGS